MAHIHPPVSMVGLPPRPVPQVDRCARLSVRSGLGRRDRRVSRAPLPGLGVTHTGVVSRTASGDVTPPSQLIRAHAPVPPPLSAFVDLMRRVLAGCCHPLLVVGPSRHYPRNPCGGDWTHTPPCPPGACTHFFPGGVGLTSRETRSAHESIPAMRLQQGAVFRGCSHSLMFSLPHSLDPRSHPPRCPKAPGGRAVYTTHRPADYPGRDVASLRDRSGQLSRLDSHQLDSDLVGCSFPHTALGQEITPSPTERFEDGHIGV